MDPRLSVLTFPQRFDGTGLRLRVLLVPRLSAAWDGNPLQPLITNFPNPGDAAPAFADADLRLEARVLAGLDRFPVNAPVDVVVPLPAAGGVANDARALYGELVAPAPGRFKLSAGPTAPGRAREGRDLHQEVPAAQLPRVVPLHRAGDPRRGHRRQLLLRGPCADRAEPRIRDDSGHRELGPDLRLLPAPSPACPPARVDSRGDLHGRPRAVQGRRLRLRRPGGGERLRGAGGR